MTASGDALISRSGNGAGCASSDHGQKDEHQPGICLSPGFGDGNHVHDRKPCDRFADDRTPFDKRPSRLDRARRRRSERNLARASPRLVPASHRPLRIGRCCLIAIGTSACTLPAQIGADCREILRKARRDIVPHQMRSRESRASRRSGGPEPPIRARSTSHWSKCAALRVLEHGVETRCIGTEGQNPCSWRCSAPDRGMCNLYRLAQRRRRDPPAVRRARAAAELSRGHSQSGAEGLLHHRSGADRADGAGWRAGDGRPPLELARAATASRCSTCARKGAISPTAAWPSPTASTNLPRPPTPSRSARTNGCSHRSMAGCSGLRR